MLVTGTGGPPPLRHRPEPFSLMVFTWELPRQLPMAVRRSVHP